MNILAQLQVRKILAVFLGGLTFALVPALALANDNEQKPQGSMDNAKAHVQIAPTLSVAIDQNGSVVVHGAKVVSVSGSTITATTAWNSAVLTWTVNTNGDTSYANGKDGTQTFSSVAVGDSVSFSGTLATGYSAFTVTAKTVRDYSATATPIAGAVLTGTASNVNAAAGTFTLNAMERGSVTVSTTGATTYISQNGTVSFGNIGLNSYVTVTGTYDTNAKTLAATSVTFPVVKAGGFMGFLSDFGGRIAGMFGGHGDKK